MPHRTFLMFILPSALAMLIFIALPVISVAVQSLFIEHDKVMVKVQSCTPFGCTDEVQVDTAATQALNKNEPLGKFNGFGTFVDRNHLATAEVGAILAQNSGLADAASRIYSLPFYRALSFTLCYTFVVTPLACTAVSSYPYVVFALRFPLPSVVVTLHGRSAMLFERAVQLSLAET